MLLYCSMYKALPVCPQRTTEKAPYITFIGKNILDVVGLFWLYSTTICDLRNVLPFSFSAVDLYFSPCVWLAVRSCRKPEMVISCGLRRD